MSQGTVLHPLPGKKRKTPDDETTSDPTNSLVRSGISFAVRPDQYPFEKVGFHNPKKAHLSTMGFKFYCEHNDEAGKYDMVFLQGTPGSLILDGKKAFWKAAATDANNQVADTPVESPTFIDFGINEKTQIWRRNCKGRHIIRISVGKGSGVAASSDKYRTVIFWANDEATAAVSKICTIVAHQQLMAIDTIGGSTKDIPEDVVKTETTKGVSKTNEATVKATCPEDTNRETGEVEGPSENATRGAQQEDSPQIEVQTLLSQDLVHEVSEAAALAGHKEQEQAYDAFVEGSVEDSDGVSTEVLDGGPVGHCAAEPVKLSENGFVQESREGSVELSDETVVDISTDRTAQGSADWTGEHDEAITAAGTDEKPFKPDGQGAEDPDPEDDRTTQNHGTEDVTEGINNNDHVRNHVENHVENHVHDQVHDRANYHVNHQTNHHANNHANNQGNNEDNDQEDSFKDWDFSYGLKASIDREAERCENIPHLRPGYFPQLKF